jgi:hypothetical protein
MGQWPILISSLNFCKDPTGLHYLYWGRLFEAERTLGKTKCRPLVNAAFALYVYTDGIPSLFPHTDFLKGPINHRAAHTPKDGAQESQPTKPKRTVW